MASEKIRVASFNVNGILNPIKRSKILTKMRKEKIDIVYLQETHLSDLEHQKLNKFGYTKVYYSSYGGKHKRGVAILISNRISFEQSFTHKDKDGRYILVKGNINGQMFTLLNVYAPPGADIAFYTNIMDLIANHSEGTLINGGDYNLHLQPSMDVSNTSTTIKTINHKFRKLLQNIGLIDIWREINPNTRQYTHFSTPHNVYTRIDYFFIFNQDR